MLFLLNPHPDFHIVSCNIDFAFLRYSYFQTKLDNLSLALLLLAALPWLVPFLRLFFKSIEVLGFVSGCPSQPDR
jgi:hypothetical protein